MKGYSQHIDHISVDIMQAYLQGDLSAEEMYSVERHLLDCGLCHEAMEGLEQFPEIDLRAVSTGLQDIISKKSSIRPMYIRLGIAASISLLLVFSIFLVFDMFKNEDEQMSLSSNKKDEKTVQEDNFTANDTIRSITPLIAENSKQVNEEKIQETVSKINPIQKQKKIVSPRIIEKSLSREKDLIEENLIAIVDEEAILEETVIENIEVEEEIAEVVFDNEGLEATKQKTIVQNTISQAKNVARTSFSSDQIDQNKTGQEKFLETTNRIIEGVVMSEEDGLPMPGVNVMLRNSTIVTTTDMKGQYKLELTEGSKSLVFSFIGRETKDVTIGNRDTVDVILDSDLSSLSVVVVNANSIEERDKKPVPSIGHIAYKDYLKDSLKYPQEALKNSIEGKVNLEFEVSETGEIRNLQVVKSLGYGCDEEAKRLVLKGASWNTGIKNGKAHSWKVQLNITFEVQ